MWLPTRRTAYYLTLVVATTLFFTVAYNVGMTAWENRSQPLYHSLEIVIQSFTTTGYGEDAPWQTPQMHFLVIGMQFAGIGLIFTAVDLFVVPWLRSALTPAAPKMIPDIAAHVIICEHTPRTETFISELDSRDQEYLLIESDEEVASDLHETGYQVIQGAPEATETLQNAHIETASAVVVDAADDTSASIVLSVRDTDSAIRVVTLIEDAELAQYHRVAGADAVLSPRQLLGERLTAEFPTAITTSIEEGIEIGDDFELVELTIEEGSELDQQTVTEARLRKRFGVTIIGAWFDSDFESPVAPDVELDAGTQLLVTGDTSQIASLREATISTVRQFSSQQIILAGYGDSGQAAYEELVETSSQLTILDIESKENVDIVGDARDPDVLKEAGVEEASGLLLTVGNDTSAIFSTLIARELNPDLRIVVRANEEIDVQKLYRAGANYVQSLATVSGRMMASTVIEDEDVLAYDEQISVVRLPAPGLEGQTLVDAQVRTTTGCTVVAVLRDGETITDFNPASFVVGDGDEVIVAGTNESITRFEQEFSS